MGSLLKDNKEIMKYWDYDKNNNEELETLLSGSGKKVWWKCPVCNGSWQVYVVNKVKGSQCPYCANRKVLIGYNDLKTKYPDISKEWNYERNGNLKPENVVYGSNLKVWWKCSKCNHEWNASIVSRTNIGNGCPKCGRKHFINKLNNIKIEKYGNIVQSHPNIAKEWNYEKNGELKPEDFHMGSSKKVWWKCPNGHEYQQIIYARTKDNYNCPVCANESHSSFPEQVLYFYCNKYLKKYKVFNRYNLENYEADIFVEKLKLAIEYDGYYYHNNDRTKSREKKKNDFFKDNAIKLIRIKENSKKDIFSSNNHDVISIIKSPSFSDLNEMLSKLFKRIKELYDIDVKTIFNVEKDRINIMDSYIYNIKKNSLAMKFPEIAKEWNYERNGNLKPDMFSYSSIKKVWWKCPKGHEWEDVINYRTHGNGCLICSNRAIMVGTNDLKSQYPEIAKEWNYEKNGELKPEDVVYGSTKKVWWKCSNGHEFQLKVCDRTKNNRMCPYCSNSQLLVGYNDLKSQYPEIAKEWNYEKNGKLKPENIIFTSNKKYWWKCSKCNHEWYTNLSYRIRQNVGCPICGINKQLESFNKNQVLQKGSLLDNNPNLAKEWNYEKNGELKPENIISTSNKKVWWKCSKGHEWEASIFKRNSGTGCPYCSNKKVLIGYNDFKSKYPDIAKDWNYEKNGELKPEDVVYGSYKSVWWKCSKGHEWEMKICDNIRRKSKCPYCK